MNQAHYQFWPKRVPKTMIYPQTPLFESLETNARRFPEQPAIIYYGKEIKYAELWDYPGEPATFFCRRIGLDEKSVNWSPKS
jgi:acyl-CoA synthetase (AMP-forming)/AMP-acid ligase II